VKIQRALLSAAVCAGLASLALYIPVATSAPASGENADQFIARVNKEMHDDYREITAAAWLGDTYINDDSQLVASKANERALVKLGEYVEQSRRFDGKPMSADTARAIQLLRRRRTRSTWPS
jgi:peptidyl-dipeptidase A